MDEGADKPRVVSHLLREAPGRETRLCLDGEQHWIEKRFRGGGGCEAWRERLRGASPRSPARREHDALVALCALGISVPEPLELREDGNESSLCMSYVAHEETLKQRLSRVDAAARRRLGTELLRLTLKLHQAGWYHRDLYLEHFLLAADDDRLVLIDLGRARLGDPPRARWFEKDLAALEHSAPASVERRERLRFLARYLDGRGIASRAERRRWAAAVGRRAARMSRHRPRHGVSHELPGEVRT